MTLFCVLKISFEGEFHSLHQIAKYDLEATVKDQKQRQRDLETFLWRSHESQYYCTKREGMCEGERTSGNAHPMGDTNE